VARNKLEKFDDLHAYPNVLEVEYSEIKQADHPMKGNWNSDFFKNPNSIVLELGCGKGEYTVGLAEIDSHKNYVGVDIKGSRMWQGASYAIEKGISNVGFLRTHIELISQFFAPREVSEIWLTFPDPQMKRAKKRLTSTRFIAAYLKFLKPEGIVHLKCDSNFQYQYTFEMAKANGFEILENDNDIYATTEVSPKLQIKTYYETQWIERGLKIKYISFIPHQGELIEPNVEIPEDTYRSFGRGAVQGE
jgi:tRNA (guanine-N7-)-methyltransferase